MSKMIGIGPPLSHSHFESFGTAIRPNALEAQAKEKPKSIFEAPAQKLQMIDNMVK